jgi:hypothetical protein
MIKQFLLLLILCSMVTIATAQQNNTGTNSMNGDTVSIGHLNIIHSDGSNGQQQVKVFTSDSIPPSGNPANYAQDDTVTIGRIKIIHTEDYHGHSNVRINKAPNNSHVKTHWLAFDFGLNNYNDQSAYSGVATAGTTPVYDYSAQGLRTFAGPNASPTEFDLVTGKSVNVDILVFRQERDIIGKVFGIEYGFGITMNNFRYKHNITYVNTNYNTTVIVDSVSFRKDKLFAEYLNIPLMFCFNFSPNKYGNDFHINVGTNIGYLVKSRTKQISSQRGKVKNNDDFNLSKFRVAPEIDFGWNGCELYANYDIVPLHKYGLKQYPFAIGVRFGGF